MKGTAKADFRARREMIGLRSQDDFDANATDGGCFGFANAVAFKAAGSLESEGVEVRFVYSVGS